VIQKYLLRRTEQGALDLYSGKPCFESGSGYCLSWLRFSVVFVSRRKSGGCRWSSVGK